jgi:hypothetical protein
MTTVTETKTWPELAIGLYDALTGRGAQINYQFDNMEIHVPSKVGSGAEHALWKINGAICITTQDLHKS